VEARPFELGIFALSGDDPQEGRGSGSRALPEQLWRSGLDSRTRRRVLSAVALRRLGGAGGGGERTIGWDEFGRIILLPVQVLLPY